jgi:hypothetical protein
VEDPPDNQPVSLPKHAGLSLPRRLELCAQLIAEPAQEAEVKVWFAFAHANLGGTYQRVGPVQFFATDYGLDNVRQHSSWGQDFDAPVELDGRWAELHFKQLPDRNGVLARVELESGPIATARQRAHDLLVGLIQAAVGVSGWLLLEGSSAYSEHTGWFGAIGFHDPETGGRRRQYGDPLDDPTAELLSKLDEGFIEALSKGHDQAEEAVAAIRWNLTASEAEPGQQLALRMRSLEQALPAAPRVGVTVRDAARRHLREAWSFFRLQDQLRDVGLFCSGAVPGTDKAQQEQIEGLHREIAQQYEVKYQGLVENLGGLASLLPAETMHGRMAREAAQDLRDGSSALRRLRRFDDRFDRLIARSVRQRNALLHGAATVPTVVQTCDEFLVQLISRIIHESINGAGRGEDLLTRLEESRADHLRRRARLDSGQRSAEALFPR